MITPVFTTGRELVVEKPLKSGQKIRNHPHSSSDTDVSSSRGSSSWGEAVEQKNPECSGGKLRHGMICEVAAESAPDGELEARLI